MAIVSLDKNYTLDYTKNKKNIDKLVEKAKKQKPYQNKNNIFIELV